MMPAYATSRFKEEDSMMTRRLRSAFVSLAALMGAAAHQLPAGAVTPPTLGVGTTTPEATFEAHGAQAGSNLTAPEPVFGLSSTPDQGNDPKVRVYQGRDQYTTGGVATNNRWLGGITASGDRSYAITARILARCTGGSGSCAGGLGQSHYRELTGIYRSYNAGSNCSLFGSISTISSPASISLFSTNLAQNPSGAPCEFGVIASSPANTTIQVNYVLEVMELIDN